METTKTHKIKWKQLNKLFIKRSQLDNNKNYKEHSINNSERRFHSSSSSNTKDNNHFTQSISEPARTGRSWQSGRKWQGIRRGRKQRAFKKIKSVMWATHHGGRISSQPKLPRQNRRHWHIAQKNSRQIKYVLYYWSSIRYVFITSYRRAILFEISENKQSISLIRFAASISVFSIKIWWAARLGCRL